MLEEQSEKVDNFLTELSEIHNLWDDLLADQRLSRFDQRILVFATSISSFEVERYQLILRAKISTKYLSPKGILSRKVERRKAYLEALKADLKKNPNEIINNQTLMMISETPLSKPNLNKKVFIVHGHDELNLRRLKDYLKDDLGIEPVVLFKKPNQGRTLIEKFESEATNVGFAFVLLTPDDLVNNQDKDYIQARPNVIFELGWFYGAIQRKNVCTIVKEGTQIHSDLQGIVNINFKSDISEKHTEIKAELQAAGII